MLIRHSRQFKKQFKKLPAYAIIKFEERLQLFLMEPNHPTLRNHKLSGKYNQQRSINITGDYRLIFTHTETTLDLEAIGTHSELYN